MKKFTKMFSMLASMLAVMVFSMVSVLAASVTDNGLGEVNWETNTVTAVGMGVPSPKARSKAQARMLARRAAIADAYRQLAEVVKGVQVDGETTVNMMEVESDVVSIKVNAVVTGAKIINETQTSDGGYEVTMRVSLFGVDNSVASAVMPRNAVRESFPEPIQSVAPSVPAYDSNASVNVRIDVTSSTPTQTGSSKAIGGYTGLIVDCRGLGLNPVMSPVIKNANGESIYGHKNLDSDYVISSGMASYTKDITGGVSRAGNNPLVVKAVSLQNHNSYPVLSVADANRVLIENKASGFLDNTNVVFIR